MSSERLLLIEPDRKQQGIARLAIGGTGIHMDIATSEDEAREFMTANKYTLFFVALDLANLLPEISNHFGIIIRAQHPSIAQFDKVFKA